jgi:pimeloyl-ACP methyl ester carboxylesterase
MGPRIRSSHNQSFTRTHNHSIEEDQMTTSKRTTLEVEIEGISIAGSCSTPDESTGRPLIVALHGGAYRGRYFDVGAAGHQSFMDFATAEGYPVVSFDRPGYGASSAVPEAQNTFDRQAELLSQAVAETGHRASATQVALVGHSIGGMIALTIASLDLDFPLIGVSATGMGAEIGVGGPADGLAAAAQESALEVIRLPAEQADQVMFGPAWTFDAGDLDDAHTSYAPAPVIELVAAPKWATEKLPTLAPRVTVPVHNELAEFDALWVSSQDTVDRFAAFFTAAPFVDARVAPATGHSIDHHLLGHALHMRQLAFVEECALLARFPRS